MTTRSARRPGATAAGKPGHGARPRRHAGGHSLRSFLLLLAFNEFTAPWWLTFLGVPLVGQLAHLAWGATGWRWGILAGSLVVGAGIGAFTWHEAAPRGLYTRVRAAVSVAFLFTALGVTAVVGVVRWSPLELVRPWADVHALVGFVLCASWNIRRTEAVRGDGSDAHEAAPAPLQEVLGLSRPVHVKRSTTSDDGVRHELVLRHPGATSAEVQSGLATLASTAGLPATGARAIPSADRADETTLVLVTQDVLKEPRHWPGPSRPGGSVAEPARIGVYEDGAPLELVRPGDPASNRNAVSLMVMGTSGAGKTEGVMLEVAELVTRRDVALWWVDTVKHAQTTPDIRPAIDWLATNKTEAKQMVAAIKHLVQYRAVALKSIGLRQWTPAAWEKLGMPYLVIHIEEYASVSELFDTDIIRAGETVRSVGISLSLSLQRASANNMSTDLRAQLGVGWCFGVIDAVDATMCLGESTIGAGAAPEVWKNRRAGMNYLEASHVDEIRWSMPARTFYPIDGVAMRQHVLAWAPFLARLDDGSAKHAGPAYANRQTCDVQAWAREYEVTPPLTLNGDTMPDTDDLTFEADLDEVRAELRELRDPELADDLDAVDPREVVDADPDGDFPLGDDDGLGVVLDPAQRNEAFAAVLARFFAQAGNPEHIDVPTSDLVDAWESLGVYEQRPDGSKSNKRAALSERLRRLERDGHAERVARGRGNKSATWRIYATAVAGPPVTDSEPDESEVDAA